MEMIEPKVVEMGSELYTAAVTGDIQSFIYVKDIESGSEDYFLRQTFPQKNNVLHLAIRRERFELIKAAIMKGLLPKPTIAKLISQGNCDGNTPLHVAAEVGNINIFKLLLHAKATGEAELWSAQNGVGNTPLHDALIHGNVEVAALLVEQHPRLARVVNMSLETPLHVAIKYHDTDALKEEAEAISTYLRLLELLVEKESYVASWRDANGSTPLHVAASITSSYNLRVIKLILEHCPQSAEVLDSSGMTMLHVLKRIPNYKEGKELLEIPEIYDLRNHQDKQGNTPLHLALKNNNINMVQVLLNSSVKQSIRNKDGISSTLLIQEQVENQRNMTTEECHAADWVDISYLRKRLYNFGMDFLVARDKTGKNVLHRLMQMNIGNDSVVANDLRDFIKQALEYFPELVCQTDLNGNTPVHILAQNHIGYTYKSASEESELLLELFELCKEYAVKLEGKTSIYGSRCDPPWLVQNVEGNTPLHEALKTNNYHLSLVRSLLALDIERIASLSNACEETLLHLIVGRPTDMEPYKKEDIEMIYKANEEASRCFDKDGLTPIMRAIQAGDIFSAKMLYKLSPDTAGIRGSYGRTLWHLLVDHPSDYFAYIFIQYDELKNQLRLRANDGYSPLHLAIERKRFDLVRLFLDHPGRELEQPKARKERLNRLLLKKPNEVGTTPADLLAALPDLPPDLDEFFYKEPGAVGVRSIWGIASTELQNYVDTMGVIAALLTTITFTAAFTVPGGLVTETGTPLLIKKPAFQVFMFFDVVSMCLSTMVLFCLLWIMATGDKNKSMVLMDFSMFLLLISIYTALMTFMAGLYATTFTVVPWIAIIALVLCSVFMVLMHKHLVMKLVIPLGKIVLIINQSIWRFLTDSFQQVG